MKKRRWSDGSLAAGLLLLTLCCAAQDSFHYQVQVDTPARSDFYRIVLSPEMIARSKPDLSDLRILGTDGRFVPYVVKQQPTDTEEYLSIPGASVRQWDSGRSVITLSWPKTYRIDLLSLTIRSPALYKRDGRILSQSGDGSWSLVTPISIDPRDTTFRIPGVRTRALRIEIDNADNPPLKTVGVSAKQAGIHLLAYLQAGASYVLLMGNPTADAPQYDLAYFTDTLTRRPGDIGVGPVHEALVRAGGPDAAVAKAKDRPAGQSGFLLWSILSTVLLLLIYFSVKMVGAIGTKKSPDDRV